MPQLVEIEGVGTASFPDEATPKEIERALREQYPTPKRKALMEQMDAARRERTSTLAQLPSQKESEQLYGDIAGKIAANPDVKAFTRGLNPNEWPAIVAEVRNILGGPGTQELVDETNRRIGQFAADTIKPVLDVAVPFADETTRQSVSQGLGQSAAGLVTGLPDVAPLMAAGAVNPIAGVAVGAKFASDMFAGAYQKHQAAKEAKKAGDTAGYVKLNTEAIAEFLMGFGIAGGHATKEGFDAAKGKIKERAEELQFDKEFAEQSQIVADEMSTRMAQPKPVESATQQVVRKAAVSGMPETARALDEVPLPPELSIFMSDKPAPELKGSTPAPPSDKPTAKVTEHPDAIVLQDLRIPDAQQGDGQGTALLQQAQELSDKTGKPLRATAHADTPEAQPRLNKWYEDNGFVQIGTDPISGKPIYQYFEEKTPGRAKVEDYTDEPPTEKIAGGEEFAAKPPQPSTGEASAKPAAGRPETPGEQTPASGVVAPEATPAKPTTTTVTAKEQPVLQPGQAKPEKKEREYKLPPPPKNTIPFGRINDLRSRPDAHLIAVRPGKGVTDDYIVKRYTSRKALETFLRKPGDWHALVKNEVDPRMVANPAFEKAKPTEAPKPAEPPKAAEPAPKKAPKIRRGVSAVARVNRETEMYGADIISWITETGTRILSKSGARKRKGAEWFKQNASLYDGRPERLSAPHHQIVYSDTGEYPDVVAGEAFKAGIIKGDTADDLWEALDTASRVRMESGRRAKAEEKMLDELAKQAGEAGDTPTAEVQADAFEKAKDKGDVPVEADNAQVGDVFIVDGERVEVTDVDPDGNVTLKDGKRFGTQTLESGEKIWVENVEMADRAEGDWVDDAAEPTPKPDPAPEPQPAAEAPKPVEQPEVRQLTKAEQQRLTELTMRQREAREGKGDALTPEESAEYDRLMAAKGQMNLLGDDSVEAQNVRQIESLQQRLDEIRRQKALTLKRASQSLHRPDELRADARTYQQEEEAIRKKIEDLKAGGKKIRDAQAQFEKDAGDLLSGMHAGLPDPIATFRAFKSLVNLAAAHIINGVRTLAAFLKATGLKANQFVRDAWSEAFTGRSRVLNANQLTPAQRRAGIQGVQTPLPPASQQVANVQAPTPSQPFAANAPAPPTPAPAGTPAPAPVAAAAAPRAVPTPTITSRFRTPPTSPLRTVVPWARQVLSEMRNAPSFTPFRRTLNEWVGKLQVTSLRVRELQAEIEKAVPSERRRIAITNWRQAGGDSSILRSWANASPNAKLRRGYEDALTLTPEEIATANRITAEYESLYQQAHAAGILETAIDNYANQVWKRPWFGGGVGTLGGRLSRTFNNAKARYWDSYAAGEQSGLVPANKDASALLGLYITEMEKVIATRELIADLTKRTASDGRPLAAPTGMSKPLPANTPMGQGARVLNFPGMKPGDTGDYVQSNHPALSQWKFSGLDTDGNPILALGNLAFHPEIAGHMKNVLGRSAITEWYQTPGGPLSSIVKAAAQGVTQTSALGKQTMLGFLSAFHQVQEGTHAVGHRVNPFFGLKEIRHDDPVVVDAMNHSLMLAGDSEAMAMFREGLDAKKIFSKIPVLGKWATDYQDYLFQSYIPRLKYTTYLHILERNRERYAPELATGRQTMGDIKYMSAQQANAAYGHLNYRDIGRNPTLQHMLQTFFLAPDFAEARGRFVGQAAKVGVAGKAGVEQFAALATIAATFYVTARILNKLNDDDYHFEEPFGFVRGNRVYSMRSVPEDMWRLFNDQRRFVYNRLSPIIGRGIVERLSGVDIQGRKVDAADALKDSIASAIPLTLRNAPVLNEYVPKGVRNDTINAWESFAGTIGLQIRRQTKTGLVNKDIESFMSKTQDPQLKKEYKRKQQQTLPESEYKKLKQALDDGDEKGIADAFKELRQKGHSRDIIFRTINPRTEAGSVKMPGFSKAAISAYTAQMTEKQRKNYEESIAEREEMYRRLKKVVE